MTQKYNFPDHKSGDTFGGVQFELLVNGVAKDLTGASISMVVGDTTFSTDTGEFVLSDPTAGEFQFISQIIDLTPDTYSYEIVITFADASIKTYIEGYWRIIE